LDEFYLIAEIVSAGKDGFVKIHLLTDVSDDILQLRNEVYLDFWGRKKKFFIEEAIKVKNSHFLKFLNFDDDRDLMVLVGQKIFLTGKNISFPKNKDFVLKDLVGCQVFRNKDLIGVVKDTFSAPANDVVEILKSDGEEILIPFVDAYFEIMDVKNKKLILKPDVGYYDDED
jgi:16S rRNA processing protein RimM